MCLYRPVRSTEFEWCPYFLFLDFRRQYRQQIYARRHLSHMTALMERRRLHSPASILRKFVFVWKIRNMRRRRPWAIEYSQSNPGDRMWFCFPVGPRTFTIENRTLFIAVMYRNFWNCVIVRVQKIDVEKTADYFPMPGQKIIDILPIIFTWWKSISRTRYVVPRASSFITVCNGYDRM